MRRATTRPVLVLTLVPLHQFLIRNFTFVVPLQTEWFLAQNGRLETSPRLNLKVIEWPAMRAEPVGSTWGKVDERAGFDLFEVVFHFNHSAAFKRHVAMRRAFRVGISAPVHVIWRRAALLVVHLSCLDGIRRRQPCSITKPDTGLGAESADTTATSVTQCAMRLPVEEI